VEHSTVDLTMTYRPILCGAIALALSACQQQASPPAETTSAPPPAPTTAAPTPQSEWQVALAPTAGNSVNGVLTLVVEGKGVRITGKVHDLVPDSTHGFHIHENGDCSAPDASSAGEHFNPTGSEHGNPMDPTHHAGDMINIVADNDGTARVSAFVDNVTLGGGTNDLTGKSVIVHAQPDDYATPPAGNSGDRLACGVID
jgi:Cu-Zn family superoxide dismutase